MRAGTRLLPMLFIAIVLSVGRVAAQTEGAVDMMIVIDNSCSMFDEETATEANCNNYVGNDTDKLRNIGSDIFFAGLGLDETNEDRYRVGVVTFGDPAQLEVDLQPVMTRRGELAAIIDAIGPLYNTNIVSALEVSYAELRNEEKRILSNKPAIVLVTDGIPDRAESTGTDTEEIENLLATNADIPVFIMLLQNADPETAPDYAEYVDFWQRMDRTYTHVRPYNIRDVDELDRTYNDILAILIGETRGAEFPVSPGTPARIFINPFVRRLVIKVIHSPGEERSEITIIDQADVEVTDDQPGVARVNEPENPVEVISINKERLALPEGGAIWEIQSNSPVSVLLDSGGAYRIRFDSPSVSNTSIPNAWLATERVSPRSDLVIRFSLRDEDDEPVILPQELFGQVVEPDGTQSEWAIPADIEPDEMGVYEIRYDLGRFVGVEEIGRFEFILNAGQAFTDEVGNPIGDERVSIASASLTVDVGQGPFIDTITPTTPTCDSTGATEFNVQIGDYAFGRADTMSVQVLSPDDDIVLTDDGNGLFSGDIAPICTTLISTLECSTTNTIEITVRLTAQDTGGFPIPSASRVVPVSVVAPACTPTPTSTPSPTPTPIPPPTPTPTPTPIPDTDADGGNDLIDTCRTLPGIPFLRYCPVWLAPVIGAIALGILAVLIRRVFPWFWVRTRWGQPPTAFVLICGANIPQTVKATHRVGTVNRTRRIKIGGDRRKAHIYVKGLKPIEFIVERDSERITVTEYESGRTRQINPRGTVTRIGTSLSGVQLHIGLSREKVVASC